MGTYGDRCGIARALDLVGERWALLVVRELLLGPKRFTDLRAGLPNLSPDVLSQRLRELEQAGLLRPPQARRLRRASRVYELTVARPRARAASCSSSAAGAARSPFRPAMPRSAPTPFVLALKTLFDPAAADGPRRHRRSCGWARTASAPASPTAGWRPRGAARRPPTPSWRAIPARSAAVLWHDRPLAQALRTGDVEIEGSTPAVKRFLGAFPAPVAP